MPLRAWTRDRTDVLPERLEDWAPADHAVRFVDAFVAALTEAEWEELGIAPQGHPGGAPAYDPRVLLGAWLYGFMSGIRSCRKLATACDEQVPVLWLTGGQRPDHNTLWRFYQRHRAAMHVLFRKTVATAVASGQVVWAIQAVDGTKIGGNAAKDQTFDGEKLAALLNRVDGAIADLEAQNRPDGPPTPPTLPGDLAAAEALRARVRAAMDRLAEADGPRRINLTDPQAILLKGRRGYVAGYNAQAAVAEVVGLPGRSGRLLTAVAVVAQADDHGQLPPMLERIEQTTGEPVATVLADGGYHDGPTLAACAARGQRVAMPEAQTKALAKPYHKDRFRYDADSDVYTCPGAQPLPFVGVKARTDRPLVRVYRGEAAACRACAAFGDCTKDARQGRALEIGPQETALRHHRAWMAQEAAQTLAARRKGLIEPVFGILKEEQRGHRFHLRGHANVAAEWDLLATGFNLRTLVRLWRAENLAA